LFDHDRFQRGDALVLRDTSWIHSSRLASCRAIMWPACLFPIPEQIRMHAQFHQADSAMAQDAT